MPTFISYYGGGGRGLLASGNGTGDGEITISFDIRPFPLTPTPPPLAAPQPGPPSKAAIQNAGLTCFDNGTGGAHYMDGTPAVVERWARYGRIAGPGIFC